MVRKRRSGLVIHRDKPEVGCETTRLGSDLAAAGDFLCSWRRWWRGARASVRRDDGARCCHELVGEVRPDQPAGGRVERANSGLLGIYLSITFWVKRKTPVEISHQGPESRQKARQKM